MKNLTKIFYLVLGSLFFVSCSQKENRLEPKRTVIAGVVENFSDEANVLVINFCNPLSDENQFAQSLSKSNGHFQTEHEYVFAQNLTIRFANKFINLFVNPGDSVFVSIDGNKVNDDFINAVTFSGDNSKLNKELFLWTDYAYKLDIPQFDNNASPEDFLASVKQVFDITQDSIEIYAKKTKMSDFLKEWAFIDHKFIVANYLMDYNAEAKAWDIFTDQIFDVFNENNFQTMFFQYHLSVCMNALTKSNDEISGLFTEKKYVQGIQLTIENLLEKAPKGIVRDVMLFKFLNEVFVEMPELYDALPVIKTAFSHELFIKKLDKIVVENSDSGQGQSLLETETQLSEIVYIDNGMIENLPEVELLRFLSEKYKDKVLYIDVWATWCGSCIKNMEYAPNLHNYFKENEVVFINLCLESNFEKWQQSIEKYNIGGENYFLGDNASKLFRAENNLHGFPSYLIIDRSEKVHNPVPNPSNLESAIQKIESCLKS